MYLDFKTKEELQSMPQTEEEHLENQNLDYEDLEKNNPDAEVRCYRCGYPRWLLLCVGIVVCAEALL